MREMLVKSRRYGVDFDRAWSSAYSRVRWPHDKEQRNDWKQQLLDDINDWRVGYEQTGEENRSLVALYALLCEYGQSDEERELALAA